MKEYLDIGPCPCDEEASQLGSPDFDEKNLAECKRFKGLLEKMFPKGTFGIKANRHEYGVYREVVAYYDEDNEEERKSAFDAESETPTTWLECEIIATMENGLVNGGAK
jgi:hypothetical protein